MIITIGIDPGKHGGLVVLGNGQHVLCAAPTPLIKGKHYDRAAICKLLHPFVPWYVTGRRHTLRLQKWVYTLRELLESPADVLPDDTWHAQVSNHLDAIELSHPNPTHARLAVLEKQSSRPGEGVVSSTTTGTGWGIWQGILAASYVPVLEVAPTRWTAALGVRGGKEADNKALHIQVAESLLPGLSLTIGKKKHDGLADAALLAIYGYRAHTEI